VRADDTTWRVLDLPHDFVVEGNYSASADKGHGYLPFGVGYYRKHMSFPAALKGTTFWLEFEAVQTASTVYLNGQLLGSHAYGYTASRYFVNASLVNWAGDNVLAVMADATNPDSWWYDGGA
jgi:beta-galactosidase